MAIDYRLLEELKRRSETQSVASSANPEKTGGGGEPPDQGVGRRLAALEASFASIDKTLAVMTEQMKHLATRDDVQELRTEIAVVTAKLDTKAGSADLAIMSGKLDTDVAALSGKVDTTLAAFSSKIDRMALATDVAELKGRVARIPTIPVLTSILVFVSLLFAAASWVFRHLPPAWTAALQ